MSKFCNPLKIGQVTLPNNLIAAPMAGFTDVGFRSLCARMGAGLTVTEMVSCKALEYGNKNCQELLLCSQHEKTRCVQIFGAQPEVMAEQARLLAPRFDIIDINMGCPMPKITKSGEGSALLKNPKLAQEIVVACKKALKNTPLTVKMRIGWDSGSINCVEFAQALEQAGADAISVHARTKEQLYSGKAEHEYSAKIAQNVSIPVIFNGDISSLTHINQLADMGASGFMIGRAILGNPQIFAKLCGQEIRISLLDIINEHIDTLLAHGFAERRVVLMMRAHLAFYLKSLQNSRKIKAKLFLAQSLPELKTMLQDFLAEI